MQSHVLLQMLALVSLSKECVSKEDASVLECT